MKLLSLILAAFFGVLSLMPNSDMDELARLPELYNHFKVHKQEPGQSNLSFVEFLKMHYGNSTHSKQSKHDNLPLQHLCNATTLFIHYSLNNFTLNFLSVPVKVVMLEINPPASTFTNSVFQPPRI